MNANEKNAELYRYLERIRIIKRNQPAKKVYRTIKFLRNREKYKELISLVDSNQKFRYEMKEEYFVDSLEKISGTVMLYERDKDSLFLDSLYWGEKLLAYYACRLNDYIGLKEHYEKQLFGCHMSFAISALENIERRVSYSLWGMQQKFLIYSLEGKKDEINRIMNKLLHNQNKFIYAICYYYAKMIDSSVDFEKYKELVNSFLPEELLDPAQKYISYKLDIFSEANVQKMKAALAYDEQMSIIDYYETYIHVLQVLSGMKRYKEIVTEIVKGLYGVIHDFRIRNIYLSLIDSNIHIDIRDDICKVIEKYTCGYYEDMHRGLPDNVDKISDVFMLCNLYVKAEISISNHIGLFPEMWEEIERIYALDYEQSVSLEKMGGYYKLLFGTSWKYKILRILTRKLKYPYNGDVLRITILNDKILTPLFYLCIEGEENKIKYLYQFQEDAPIASQLHLYMLTGNMQEQEKNQIEPNRLKYYGIRWLVRNQQYEQAIKECREMIAEYTTHPKELYGQERIRRILYKCYMDCSRYKEAMKLYVESYLIGNEQIVQMELYKLIHSIEEIAEDDDELKADVYRPIILRLYFKNNDLEVISSYMDYIEAQKCNTIIEYINKKKKLTSSEILFLDTVCTQTLLMQDYVSKTVTHGSVADLRASILRKLISVNDKNQNKYIAELNSIYKIMQLQKRMDSFNHNRIFIDKENLFRYLEDKLGQEFVKFQSVQDIRKVANNTKEELLPLIEKIWEDYWDKTKFYKDMVNRISSAYLSESPYSLENFLSTRIRHNFCNDNLKKVFEEQKLFSKKPSDDSDEYIVNEYWETLLPEQEYIMVKEKLSDFSSRIDKKIQEIKDKWIRISTGLNDEGLFRYWSISDYLVDYWIFDFDTLALNPKEFYQSMIRYLDDRTNYNLDIIRKKIDEELKPYYYEKIKQLEHDVRKLTFTERYKKEMLSKIETTKAKYVEDLERFKDIFNMENEVYPDFNLTELVEFCRKIEEEMNPDFAQASIDSKMRVDYEFSGDVFPYMVDIMDILLRNAVQHSHIDNMKRLEIVIDVSPFFHSEMQKYLKEDRCKSTVDYDFVICISNNLSNIVDIELVRSQIKQKIENIYAGKYGEESNKEGGTGLYKVARTVDYNLNTNADYNFKISNNSFQFYIAVNLNRYIKEKLK